MAVTPGPVEIGVQEEIGDSAELRPGLAETALAFARLLDNPGARNVHPSAAKVLAGLLGELGRVGVPRRRSQLALVRSMTEKDGA
ncbi:hypothetical protein [Mycobacterium senriense]|uniref:hypothetical protein n=1 Tax=Mycobacterium senriense TaxID=2775496 RepID=UPI0020230090|nr:hypothetical protein [Mycobacterium senriense]